MEVSTFWRIKISRRWGNADHEVPGRFCKTGTCAGAQSSDTVLAFDWSQSFDCKFVIQTGFLKTHQEFGPQLWQILVRGTQGNLWLRETIAEAPRNRSGTCYVTLTLKRATIESVNACACAQQVNMLSGEMTNWVERNSAENHSHVSIHLADFKESGDSVDATKSPYCNNITHTSPVTWEVQALHSQAVLWFRKWGPFSSPIGTLVSLAGVGSRTSHPALLGS